MVPPAWEGEEVLRDWTWVPAEPSAARSARVVAERWPHLVVIAAASVDDPWDRTSHVIIAHDPHATDPQQRFLAVSMMKSIDATERAFDMAHQRVPTLTAARAWLHARHGDQLQLNLSTAITDAARQAAAVGRTLGPKALPPATAQAPAPTRPARTRAPGR